MIVCILVHNIIASILSTRLSLKIRRFLSTLELPDLHPDTDHFLADMIYSLKVSAYLLSPFMLTTILEWSKQNMNGK